MRNRFVLGLCFLAAACRDNGSGVPSVEERCAAADEQAGIVRPEGWAPLSHCKFAPADVGKVFPIEMVGKMTISMTAAEYAAMQADLASLPVDEGGDYGDDAVAACAGKAERDACEIDVDSGLEPGICAPWEGAALSCFPNSWRAPMEWVRACAGLAEGAMCSTAEFAGNCSSDGVDLACQSDDGPGAGGAKNPCSGRADGDACTQGTRTGVCTKTTRLLVCQADGFDPADLSGEYDDAATPKPKYFHADVEYAGARWTSVGIRYKGNNSLETAEGEKKPFRLKLDEWEDENKAVTNQRIFGFQALSLSPNQTDPTNLHQVLAAEAFREAGVPAPYASFIEVYLDTGSGPRLLGLYAMSEFPDDRLPRRVFGEDDGNMYKPDGRGAFFVVFVAASMDKRNNEGAGYQDVEDFIAALHGAQNDRAAWRARLSETFDIVGFAKAYAVNQAIANFDTYGTYAHNYYLYNRGGALTFIPWDFDYAFDGTGGNDLGLWTFGGQWPLLQALASDAELFTTYTDALAAFADAQLASGKLAARVDALAALIRPALQREEEVRPGVLGQFDAALPDLKNHLERQGAAIAKLLTTQHAATKPHGLRYPRR